MHYNSVKDKTNILGYNVWSATEYSNNFSGFVHVDVSEMSNDYSTIGRQSIHLIPNQNKWWLDLPFENIESDTQYTLSGDIYLESGQATLRLANGNTDIQSVYCSSLGLSQLSLSFSITDDLDYPHVRFLCYDGLMYIDNIKLTTP